MPYPPECFCCQNVSRFLFLLAICQSPTWGKTGPNTSDLRSQRDAKPDATCCESSSYVLREPFPRVGIDHSSADFGAESMSDLPSKHDKMACFAKWRWQFGDWKMKIEDWRVVSTSCKRGCSEILPILARLFEKMSQSAAERISSDSRASFWNQSVSEMTSFLAICQIGLSLRLDVPQSHRKCQNPHYITFFRPTCPIIKNNVLSLHAK